MNALEEFTLMDLVSLADVIKREASSKQSRIIIDAFATAFRNDPFAKYAVVDFPIHPVNVKHLKANSFRVFERADKKQWYITWAIEDFAKEMPNDIMDGFTEI